MDNAQLRTMYAEFCREMLKWVQDGLQDAVRATSVPKFNRRRGLCSNLECWCEEAYAEELHVYQVTLFQDAGLNPSWPFDGTCQGYLDSKFGAGLYANEARLQWLRDHAEH